MTRTLLFPLYVGTLWLSILNPRRITRGVVISTSTIGADIGIRHKDGSITITDEDKTLIALEELTPTQVAALFDLPTVGTSFEEYTEDTRDFIENGEARSLPLSLFAELVDTVVRSQGIDWVNRYLSPEGLVIEKVTP